MKFPELCFIRDQPICQLFTTGFGGKGANQAVMAAHCGAEVHFVGKLGKDVFGDAIAENFVKVGIHSEYVDRSDTPNGVAHIWVDGKGENRIIIIPGANHEIEIARAVNAINLIAGLQIVVAQCEIKQDVDTGVDDAFAVLFAAMHPDINLLGITCVDGNTNVDQVVANTFKVLVITVSLAV